MGKSVTVVPYDPRWTEEFLKIRGELDAALAVLSPAVPYRIEHVGSTSVPGLSAKPVIDLDLAIPSMGDFEAVKGALEAAGYRHEGDLGIPAREAFGYADKPGLMRHHLYVCPENSPELNRHLTFRDRLRAHPAEAEEYGRIKTEAAARHPGDMDAYIAEKSPFIEKIYRRCGLIPPVRPACSDDAERIAEILVFCYRLNFYPIFRDDDFYFGGMRADRIAAGLRTDPGFPERFLVYDDGAVKAFAETDGEELIKLFAEPVCQNRGIGGALLEHAVRERGIRFLWALEKNTRAIRFYERHGFRLTGERKPEEGTAEFLVRMERGGEAQTNSVKVRGSAEEKFPAEAQSHIS